MKRGLKNLKRSLKDKRKVSGLALEIYNKINSIKRSKKTAYKELEILKNYKTPIGTPLVYYIWGL